MSFMRSDHQDLRVSVQVYKIYVILKARFLDQILDPPNAFFNMPRIV
jgi:hypothetical protein